VERRSGRLSICSVARAVYGYRRQVWLMVFVGYFDGSGTKSDPASRVVTVAGYASTESQWRKFEAEWAAALAAEDVPLFHMKDFAHSQRAFKAWRGDEPRRQRFLKALLGIIRKRTQKKFSISVLLDHYRAMNEKYMLREAIGGPYAIAAQMVITCAELWMRKRHPDDGMLYVFEKGDDDQGELQRIFKKYFSNMPVEPLFVEKSADVGTPLQAADFIAYEHAKAFNDFLKSGKTRARESAVPQMPYSHEQSIRFMDTGMLGMLVRDLRVPRRRTS
jgi:uncharacterized protein DUF3800